MKLAVRQSSVAAVQRLAGLVALDHGESERKAQMLDGLGRAVQAHACASYVAAARRLHPLLLSR